VDCAFDEHAPYSLTAPVVFAGYGIREEKLGRDDFRGLDVRGKIVLVLAGVPAGEPWQRPELLTRYASTETDERWETKVDTAHALGAAALLGVEGDDFAVRDLAKVRPEARLFVAHDASAPDQAIPLVRVSAAVADALLAAADLDHASARAAQPRALPGATASIGVSGAEKLVVSRNVIGVIAGSDPALRDEAVVIGAHMDHLGRVGDKVYPGADDNASGVAALIEIAKAMATLPVKPKRTVVIAFWTGEEEGELGSGYYVRHPLWPLARTAAYLNLDMIGHPWSMDEITKLVADTGLPAADAFLAKVKPADFVEPGLPPGAADLEVALRHAGHATGLALHLDRTDGTHGGSDYREFARAHVPFIRFFGNFFPAYHEPGDTFESLDSTQVQRVARLAFVTAWLLAER
jgi:Zn-dependent M28 family amino/carboxypeptidase